MSRLVTIALLLLALALTGCGASAPQQATTAPAADTQTTPAPTPAAGASQLTVNEPWVRAAVITGAAMPAADATAPAMGQATTPAMGHGGADAAPAMGQATTPAMGHGGADAAGGSTSAAYLTLVNTGSSADALLGAASDVADIVELHTVEMVDNVMQMRPVPQIDIPANGEVALKPGGFHIMLIGIKHDLKPGETVKLTLTFKNSGAIQVEAPVRMP